MFFLHLFLGLPFPALMAVIAFCITLIPLIGPALYWGIATVVALFTNPIAALIFAALASSIGVYLYLGSDQTGSFLPF